MKINRILIIEDNPGDIMIIKKAIRQNVAFKVDIDVISDGAEAMEHIRNQSWGAGKKPHLILLDLNLPKANGQEILALAKKSVATKSIPVVIFSGSSLPDDIRQAYEANANSYVNKPEELSAYIKAIQSIEDYWFSIANIPEE